MSILAFESIRGVGILATPMALAWSCSRAGRGRVLPSGATKAGSASAALSADCSARHCRPGCRTLYLRFERPRGQRDLAALRAPLAWCITAGEGVIWGLGAKKWWIVSTIWASDSTCLVSGPN